MKVLFICHVEPIFKNYFPSDYLDELYDLMEGYHRVINLESGIEAPYEWIVNAADESWEWGWGYEVDSFCFSECQEVRENDFLVEIRHVPECEGKWIIPAYGHGYTWIPYQLREDMFRYQKADVYICGGADGSCLADWEDVLRHEDIKYTRVEELIWNG